MALTLKIRGQRGRFNSVTVTVAPQYNASLIKNRTRYQQEHSMLSVIDVDRLCQACQRVYVINRLVKNIVFIIICLHYL